MRAMIGPLLLGILAGVSAAAWAGLSGWGGLAMLAAYSTGGTAGLLAGAALLTRAAAPAAPHGVSTPAP